MSGTSLGRTGRVVNWFKVSTVNPGGKSRTFVGCSPDSAEAIAERAGRGEYIRLEQLLYMAQGEVKDFVEWDKSVVPTVHINPAHISTVMQFKGDPRVTPRK